MPVHALQRRNHQAIRNRGTIGGSLALADPSADWPTTMAALGAIIEWHGAEGKNSCAAEEFVAGDGFLRAKFLAGVLFVVIYGKISLVERKR